MLEVFSVALPSAPNVTVRHARPSTLIATLAPGVPATVTV